MPVRVKVDEDLPGEVADVFRARGFDATTVVEQGWKGTPDDVLWPRVEGKDRWLVTADKAFADLRRHPPGTHAGIILLRLDVQNRRAYGELASMVADTLDLDQLGGSVVVATDRGIRIRRAHHPGS